MNSSVAAGVYVTAALTLVVFAAVVSSVLIARRNSINKEGFFDARNNGYGLFNRSGRAMVCDDMERKVGRYGDMCNLFSHKGENLQARNINVQNRLHFRDPGFTTRANFNTNNSDSYYLQKRIGGSDRSSLDLTINDNGNEKFRILGNSCAQGPRGCHGPGVQQHVFQANGDASHRQDLNVGRHLNVNRRLHFRDPKMDDSYNWGSNNSDTYFLEKRTYGRNNSSLDLTLNDDADESLRIMGNSCRQGPRGCAGPGVQQHKLQANGDAWHRGQVSSQNRVCVDGACLGRDDIRRLKALLGNNLSELSAEDVEDLQSRNDRTAQRGGTVYTHSGYVVTVYEQDGQFRLTRDAVADVMLVGGGGGGGHHGYNEFAGGGGGGAGGVMIERGVRITAGQTYEIKVGAGGDRGRTGGRSPRGNGKQGGDSEAFGVVALGGGGGGNYYGTNRGGFDLNGGSGGGGGYNGGRGAPESGGSSLRDQGHAGGNGGSRAGGGGGGADEAGSDAVGCCRGGDGGAGRDVSDMFGERVGANGWIGGGGGGGSRTRLEVGEGGKGGGARGGNMEASATEAIDGTGGGGGGGNSPGPPSRGASGVVVIRYV